MSEQTPAPDLEAELAMWKRAAVLAVAPLEAMGIAGIVPTFAPEMQKGIAEGVAAVRDACARSRPQGPTKGTAPVKYWSPSDVEPSWVRDRFLATPEPPEAAQGIREAVAGALFDFAGYLTSMPKPITLGATEWATPAVDALTKWAAKRGFPLEDADVMGWQARAALSRSQGPGASGQEGDVNG